MDWVRTSRRVDEGGVRPCRACAGWMQSAMSSMPVWWLGLCGWTCFSFPRFLLDTLLKTVCFSYDTSVVVVVFARLLFRLCVVLGSQVARWDGVVAEEECRRAARKLVSYHWFRHSVCATNAGLHDQGNLSEDLSACVFVENRSFRVLHTSGDRR